MATITFLGGEETGDVAFVEWGRFRFVIRQPTECDDPHIIAKARGNRFFHVGGPVDADEAMLRKFATEPGAVLVKPDPMAKARAAKAAKRAAQEDAA